MDEVALGGATLEELADEPYPKRGRSAEHPRLKAVTPTEYHGKSQKELTEFLRQCDRYFSMRPCSDAEKVLFASQYLRDTPSNAWEREPGKETSTWPALKKFLQDQLSPEGTRGAEATRKWKETRQRPGQKVAALVSYLDELETHMDPINEKMRAYGLLHALRDDLRKGVYARGKLPETRSGVEEAAIMVEAALGTSDRKDEVAQKDKAQGSKRRFPDKGKGADKAATSEVATGSRGSARPFPGHCNKCGKKGHRAVDCRIGSGPVPKEEQHPKA